MRFKMWKQKIKEYMNSNRNMDNMILLCPDYISSKITIGKRHTTNGTYYKILYYQGLKKKNFSGYLSEEQLHTTLEEINKAKNNITDIFKISKTDLTPDIIRRFRYVEPILEYDHCEVLIDPYILGLWLGDGDSDGIVLTNVDIPVIDAWKAYATDSGYDIKIYGNKERNDGIEYNTEIETSFVGRYAIVKPNIEISTGINVKIESNPDGKYECKFCNTIYNSYGSIWAHYKNRPSNPSDKCMRSKNIVKEKFKHYNLLMNKHIPDDYLRNSKEVRLKLLAGLIDTDGYKDKGGYSISQKNKVLSDDIVKLCRSLGLYTQIKEQKKTCMYKGERKEGIYFHIVIRLNQFSPEIPVLLERKKQLYRTEVHKKLIYNPFIDINGDIIVRNPTKWDEDMKIMLYSITAKIKSLQPEGFNIPWKSYYQFDDRFKDLSPRALDTMYFKTLVKENEHYDSRIVDVDIEVDDLFDPKWKENYYAIHNKHKRGEYLSQESDPVLYNWLYCQKQRTKLLPQQVDMMHKLRSYNVSLYDEMDFEVFTKNIQELIDFIKQNKKTPVESTKLGNWLKGIKRDYNDNKGSVYNDTRRRGLWEEVVKKYGHIVSKHNHTKKIRVTFPNAEVKIFRTQNDVVRLLNSTKGTVKKYLESGELLKGHKLEEVVQTISA